MKAVNVFRLCLVGALMLGIFVAWDACLAQKTDINMRGGACYTCGSDTCDSHSVWCEAESKTGGCVNKKDICCRGGAGGRGDCTTMPNQKQCVFVGCKKRQDEMCND